MERVAKIEQFVWALQKLQGEELYAELVQRVWKLLGADYVFAGDFVPEDEAVDVRAFCASGEMKPPYRYSLAGTPCVGTLYNGENACLFLGDVVEQFPYHHRLSELGVTSYVGVPVLDAAGKPCGLVVLLYKGMPTKTELIPIVLELASTRLSHEMQRRDVELRGEDTVLPELDQRLLAQRLHQCMCVLRLHLSVANQLITSDSVRCQLDRNAESIRLVIEQTLNEESA